MRRLLSYTEKEITSLPKVQVTFFADPFASEPEKVARWIRSGETAEGLLESLRADGILRGPARLFAAGSPWATELRGDDAIVRGATLTAYALGDPPVRLLEICRFRVRFFRVTPLQRSILCGVRADTRFKDLPRHFRGNQNGFVRFAVEENGEITYVRDDDCVADLAPDARVRIEDQGDRSTPLPTRRE